MILSSISVKFTTYLTWEFRLLPTKLKYEDEPEKCTSGPFKLKEEDR
jgi:hypothetical protein